MCKEYYFQDLFFHYSMFEEKLFYFTLLFYQSKLGPVKFGI